MLVSVLIVGGIEEYGNIINNICANYLLFVICPKMFLGVSARFF